MEAVVWVLAGTALIFALVIVQRDAWARFWFGLEDPRAMGLLRILFALVVICNVNGLWEYVEFLFSRDGILPADVARRTFAAKQFADDSVWVTAGRLLAGPKFSLLLFWDSPTAVWVHIAAFEVAALLLMVGLWTRASAIACFVLMTSIFDRNPLFLEGTDVVIRVFLLYLVLARSGHAWSVDNWRRCRTLPAQDSAPVYRPIPVWPRRLMMLQLAVLYFTTGALKTGAVWANGDAIYYALNLDHFYRLPPQALSAALGTNVLRVMTWTVRFGEMGFALVFLGAFVRVATETTSAPRYPRVATVVKWVRRWILGRRIWITWATCTMAGIFVLMNIGQFQTAMLVLCLVYVRGEEVGRIADRMTKRQSPPSVAASPTLGATRLPSWALVATGALGYAAVATQLAGGPGTTVAWTCAAFVAGVVAYRGAQARRHRGADARAIDPHAAGWAYGPIGRSILGAALAWHTIAVGLWLVPKRDDTTELRDRGRTWVRPWLVATRTTQGWGMFAPNPPRQNVFMQVLVTDRSGDVWDMNSDVYAPSRRPIPFVFNDRMRKMNRRIIGGERGRGSWYRKWYARWQCRDFSRHHPELAAKTIELVRLSYRIPTPEKMRERGWYRPEQRLRTHGKRKVVFTLTCPSPKAPAAQ